MAAITRPYQVRTTTQRPYSGTAITAFVLSLLWIGGLGSVAAIVCAAVSMRRTRTHNQAGTGLAVAALIIGFLGLIASAWLIVVIAAAGAEMNSQFQEVTNCVNSNGANCPTN